MQTLCGAAGGGGGGGGGAVYTIFLSDTSIAHVEATRPCVGRLLRSSARSQCQTLAIGPPGSKECPLVNMAWPRTWISDRA